MENKPVYRLAPCPAFDVTGTENWLEEMAGQGLHLSDESWGSLTVFQRGTPKAVRYRLEAAPVGTGMWTRDDGYPPQEALEFHQAMGWEYVTNRGEFHIYRTEDPDAPEPDTDPSIKALALSKVKARRKSSCISLFLWTVVYPILMLRGAFFLTAVELGTWFFLAGLLLILWGLVDAVRRVILLRKMERQLRENGKLDKSPCSRRTMLLHYGKTAAKVLLIVLWFGYLFFFLNDTVRDQQRIPLSQYTEELPFATIADFAGGNVVHKKEIITGMGFNTLLEWSDILAPRCISYWENTRVSSENGRSLSGGLTVDYYETRSPWLAKIMAAELHRQDRWKKDYAPMEISVPGADFAAVYTNDIHFPTVVLQKGPVVLRAFFYQTEGDDLPVETWVSMLAESIGA